MNDLEAKFAAVIAKCWTDPEFKQRFLREPKAVIAEVLMDLPPETEVVVVEDTRKKRHIVLPEPPAEGFETADVDVATRRLMGTLALYCPPMAAPAAATGVVTDLYCPPKTILYCVAEALPYCLPVPKKPSENE